MDTARKLAAAAERKHRRQHRSDRRRANEDATARLIGAVTAKPRGNSEENVPESDDLLQGMGISNGPSFDLSDPLGCMVQVLNRTATGLALGIYSLGLALEQGARNLSDSAACRLGFGVRLAGLKRAGILRPECLTDVVTDLGRHNAAILRNHRHLSDAVPWLPLDRSILDDQLPGSFGEAAARAAASIWLREDPSRWCNGLGVSPVASDCPSVSGKDGAIGAAAVAAAANLPRNYLSSVKLHFRPIRSISDDLDLGPPLPPDARGSFLEPAFHERVSQSLNDLLAWCDGSESVGMTREELKEPCDVGHYSQMWSNLDPQIPPDTSLTAGRVPVTHGILLVGNTDAVQNTQQLVYGQRVSFPSMGWGDAQNWASACHEATRNPV